MKTPARLLGHPIHQMLIVLPLGMLAGSIIFDIMNRVTSSARWADVAFWMIGAGVVTGLLAAIFGVADWLSIPKGTRAKRVGLVHGAGNVVVVLLFAASFALRIRNPQAAPPLGAFILSLLGGGLALVTGWLGGELVNRLGVGVDAGANLNAPSSLSNRLARPGQLTPRSQRVPGRDMGAEGSDGTAAQNSSSGGSALADRLPDGRRVTPPSVPLNMGR